MNKRGARPRADRAGALAGVLLAFFTQPARAQSADELLARLDRAAASFTGAKADIRRAIYTAAIRETDLESGAILVRRSSPGQVEFRIDITGDNAYSLVVGAKQAEYYHPMINEVEVYDLRRYRDLAQTLMALGFGMSGRDIQANYAISNVRRDTTSGQPATAMDLAPKSQELVDRLHLQRVELWISDASLAPAQEKVYFRDGDTWTINYSNVQMNIKIPASALELPKNARREKRN